MDKHYKYGGVIGTHWNSQQGPDGYRLQFETDDKTLYKYMEKAAQKCIDRANKKNRRRKNDEQIR